MNLLRLFQIVLTLVALITSTRPGRSKRIAGHASLAKPGQFPHAVFLYWYWNVKPLRQLTRFKCTSNLLSAHYVVTAAHCYYHLLYTYRNYTSTRDFVHVLTTKQGHTYTRAGSVDGFGLDRGWQDRQGIKLFIPGAYARPSSMFDMDVALVYLPIAFVLGIPHISHVAIARISEVPAIDDFRDCLAAGFGYVNAKQMQLVIRPDYKYGTPAVMKNKLHVMKVKFALNNFCRYLQQRLDGSLIYFDEFYGCARSIGTIKNSTYATGCFGDAGGPVVCSGLLVGIMVQRRERVPCDYHSSDTAFTMYTLLGEADVDAWLRKHLELGPLTRLPPWDPWADVTEPPLEELRMVVGVTVEGTMKNGGTEEERTDDISHKEGSITQRQDGTVRESRRIRESSAKKGKVRNTEEKLERAIEELDFHKKEAVNGSVHEVDKVAKDIAKVGREKINKDDEISGITMEGRQLVFDGLKLVGNKLDTANFTKSLRDGQGSALKPDSSVLATNLNASRLANTTSTEEKPPRREKNDQILNRGRRVAEVSKNLETETNPTQERIRRNVNGGVVEGDIRDDDPDLLRLLTLIRRGGVELDPVRRKRQEARWQLREAMAKDLLRATRDLDPGALDRFGMGADVLTRDEVGEDAWAREVWEDVFKDDRGK